MIALFTAGTLHADPQLTSWITTYSGQYARIYETDAQLAAGTSETTWTRGSISQTLPLIAASGKLTTPRAGFISAAPASAAT